MFLCVDIKMQKRITKKYLFSFPFFKTEPVCLINSRTNHDINFTGLFVCLFVGVFLLGC